LLADLEVGELIAEGGEGRVYQLPLQPHLLFKSYRRPVAPWAVEDLVSWPGRALDAQAAARVGASAAWPLSTVLDSDCSVTGLLVPRAPKRFSLRHRDGATRLASLSYLTTDPAHRAAAYGVRLPEPGAVERFGLVYALARLLDAFENGQPCAAHGDLSTKNVLWSLQRGPEVFVIDCDNSERFDATGATLGDPGRRRAMTPNWEDPAVAKGDNPTVASDRYSLALIFLRVVGAANYPIQARQRSGEPVSVEFPIPPAVISSRLLGPGATLWELCGRGLSLTHPADRPPASAWVGVLEAVLDSIGAAETMRSVWANQGGGQPSPVPSLSESKGSDVRIHPVAAPPRRGARGGRGLPVRSWVRGNSVGAVAATVRTPSGGIVRPAPAVTPSWMAGPVGSPSGLGAAASPGAAGPAIPAPAPVMRDVIATVRGAVAWWLHTHRRTFRTLISAGARRQRARALAFCAAVDAAIAVGLLFVAAMAVSPLLGI
jgi:hypothetical protein